MNQQFREVDIMSPREMKSCDWRYEEHRVFIVQEKKSPGGTTFGALWNNRKQWYISVPFRERKRKCGAPAANLFCKRITNMYFWNCRKTSDHHSHWLHILVLMVVKSIFKKGTWMQISLKLFSPALHFHVNKLVMHITNICSGKK